MTFALADRRMTRCTLTLPYTGVWHAEVSLDEPAVLSGAVTLELGGLSLRGTIVTGDAYAGAADYRVVGGAGGWKKELPTKSYDGTIGLAMVLGDAATDCGEKVQLAAGVDRELGPAYVRPKGQAIRSLTLLVQYPFWVDADGVTQVGPRPTGSVSTPFELTAYMPKERVAVIASETPEVFVNGYTLDLQGAPTMTIGTIVHRLDEGQIRTELQGIASAAEADPIFVLLRAIVREMTADDRYRGVFEYRVVAQTADRVSVTPARPHNGMPALSNVPVRLGIPGARATFADGASVLVAFIDGEPSRPQVIGVPAADDAASDPTSVQLGDQTDSVAVGTEAGRVLRFGDVIMMPVGQPPVPTATLILGAKLGDVTTPVGPIVASRVRA